MCVRSCLPPCVVCLFVVRIVNVFLFIWNLCMYTNRNCSGCTKIYRSYVRTRSQNNINSFVDVLVAVYAGLAHISPASINSRRSTFIWQCAARWQSLIAQMASFDVSLAQRTRYVWLLLLCCTKLLLTDALVVSIWCWHRTLFVPAIDLHRRF